MTKIPRTNSAKERCTTKKRKQKEKMGKNAYYVSDDEKQTVLDAFSTGRRTIRVLKYYNTYGGATGFEP